MRLRPTVSIMRASERADHCQLECSEDLLDGGEAWTALFLINVKDVDRKLMANRQLQIDGHAPHHGES